MKKTVRCPTCKGLTSFDATNLFRPFCSERCQLLDLGAWADEKFAIPAEQLEKSSVNENQNMTDQHGKETFNPPPKDHLN